MDLKIFWSPVTGVTSYKVGYKLAANPTWTVSSEVTTNYIVLTGLTACETYDFKIISVCTPQGLPEQEGAVSTQMVNDGTCCVVTGDPFSLRVYNDSALANVNINSTTSASNTITYSPVLSEGMNDVRTLDNAVYTSDTFTINVFNNADAVPFYATFYKNGSWVGQTTPTVIPVGTSADIICDFNTVPALNDVYEIRFTWAM